LREIARGRPGALRAPRCAAVPNVVIHIGHASTRFSRTIVVKSRSAVRLQLRTTPVGTAMVFPLSCRWRRSTSPVFHKLRRGLLSVPCAALLQEQLSLAPRGFQTSGVPGCGLGPSLSTNVDPSYEDAGNCAPSARSHRQGHLYKGVEARSLVSHCVALDTEPRSDGNDFGVSGARFDRGGESLKGQLCVGRWGTLCPLSCLSSTSFQCLRSGHRCARYRVGSDSPGTHATNRVGSGLREF